MFGKGSAHEVVIDVAVNRHQGRHCCQRVCDPEITNVACVPYFVAGGQVMQDPVVDVAVGIADESNSHATNFVAVVRLAPSWRSP